MNNSYNLPSTFVTIILFFPNHVYPSHFLIIHSKNSIDSKEFTKRNTISKIFLAKLQILLPRHVKNVQIPGGWALADRRSWPRAPLQPRTLVTDAHLAPAARAKQKKRIIKIPGIPSSAGSGKSKVRILFPRACPLVSCVSGRAKIFFPRRLSVK